MYRTFVTLPQLVFLNGVTKCGHYAGESGFQFDCMQGTTGNYWVDSILSNSTVESVKTSFSLERKPRKLFPC